jgi:flagellar assembly factor FliW
LKITTTRFAALDVEEEKMILMQRGILGFEGYKRFLLLLPSAGEPLLWLQAADDPALAFVVANPAVLKKNYQPAIIEYELNLLDIQRDEDIVLLAIVTVHAEPWHVTANLRAPVLINATNRKANQIVFDDPAYPLQYPIVANDARRDRDAMQQQAEAGRLDDLSVAMTVV